jgi:hypothetical protein
MFYIRFQNTGVNKSGIYNWIYIGYLMIKLIRASKTLQALSTEKQKLRTHNFN